MSCRLFLLVLSVMLTFKPGYSDSKSDRAKPQNLGKVTLTNGDGQLLRDIDVGKQLVRQEVTALVTIENSTEHSLMINQTKTSCGCTAVYATNQPIPPGKESELLVGLRLGKPGAFRNRITLQTNLGDFQFHIKGMAQNRIEVRNEQVHYDKKRDCFSVSFNVNDETIELRDLQLAANGHRLLPTSVNHEACMVSAVPFIRLAAGRSSASSSGSGKELVIQHLLEGGDLSL